MWKVIPNLLLGDREDSGDLPLLLKNRITHIVNCAEELPCRFEREFKYLWLKLNDPDSRFGSKLSLTFSFMDEGRRNGNVLVHCTAGVSRSPAVILAYLCHKGASLEQACARLSAKVLTGVDEVLLEQIAERFGEDRSIERLKAHSLILLGRKSCDSTLRNVEH